METECEYDEKLHPNGSDLEIFEADDNETIEDNERFYDERIDYYGLRFDDKEARQGNVRYVYDPYAVINHR
jgi:hypothetical protein